MCVCAGATPCWNDFCNNDHCGWACAVGWSDRRHARDLRRIATDVRRGATSRSWDCPPARINRTAHQHRGQEVGEIQRECSCRPLPGHSGPQPSEAVAHGFMPGAGLEGPTGRHCDRGQRPDGSGASWLPCRVKLGSAARPGQRPRTCRCSGRCCRMPSRPPLGTRAGHCRVAAVRLPRGQG